MAKVQNINSKRQKTADRKQIVSKLAEIFNCKVRYVNYVLSGQRGKRSKLADDIRIAYTILSDKYNESESQVRSLFTEKRVA